MDKCFKEQRVSFLILNKEKFRNSYLNADFTDRKIVADIANEMIISLEEKDEGYREIQNKYFNVMDYDSASMIYRNEARNKLSMLLNEEKINLDSIDFLKKYYLFYSSSEYFKSSWYFLPYLEFSEDFYEQVLPKNSNYLINHRNDSIQENFEIIEVSLSTLEPVSEKSLYEEILGPKYYLIGEYFLNQIFSEINSLNFATLDRFLKFECDFLLEIISKSKEDKVYIVLTSFET